MEKLITEFLGSFFSPDNIATWYTPASLLFIVIAAFVVYWLCHRVIAVVVKIVTLKTETEWDDDLLNDRVLRATSQLAPALLVAYLLPQAFSNDSTWQVWLDKGTDLYIVWAFIHLINTFLQSLFDAFDRRGRHRVQTMRGVLQMFKLFFIIIGIIIGASILFGKNPITIITALGASAAILMLVFQDTILGVVAGIQLTVNDMLKKGDWISVPKCDANGEVIDISLTAVKVRNWDNTVTTVPPYTLIKDSFRNYNPMQTSGGRRVSRSINIDVNTIRFLTSDEVATLSSQGLLKGVEIDGNQPAINLYLLTAHLESYLSTHPMVNKEMTMMVRQLQPTPEGLPLELYFFVNDTAWVTYEHTQARIFEYVYAGLHAFGLSAFQSPAGTDIKQMNR